MDLIILCLKTILKVQLISAPIITFFLYYPFKARGMYMSATLPEWYTVAWQVFVFVVVEDTMFYWSHRLLHHPSIYKHIHKQHHEFKSTIGIASEYAHPVEGLIANLIPFVTGPLLVGRVHMFTLLFWMFLRVVETVDAHSGFVFPFSPFSLLPFQGGAERHDYHHLYNIGSFGSFFNLWDWFMGTDQPFRTHQAKQRGAAAASGSSITISSSSSQGGQVGNQNTIK